MKTDKLKLLYHLHAYPPTHNAGAEWMAHAMFKWLVAHGHECHVVTTCPANYEIDGVKVFRDDFDSCNREWNWCDLGLTHLVRSGKAWNWHAITYKPIVYVVHNTFTNRLVEVKQDFALIYNTEHAREDGKAKGYRHHSTVLHPPVYFDDYHTDNKRRKYITLINCWPRKGGNVLYDLAKSMPDRQFLGVKGGYGEQVIKPLPNLTYVENTPDIKSIYEQTRILIMPSVYESYGRTAVEAMCSGIPVIASDTPGLRESLGDCGLFVPALPAEDENFLEADPFEHFIKMLDDKAVYKDISTRSLARAKMLDERNETEMQSLEKWFIAFRQFKRDTSQIIQYA